MGKAIARIVAIVIVAIVASSVVAGAFYITRASRAETATQTVCSACFVNEPVIDIVIPMLISQSNTYGRVNAQLNVTRGQTLSLDVVIYPSATVDVRMQFSVYSNSGGGKLSNSTISSSFSPSTLDTEGQRNASTVLTISISNTAFDGTYSAVVSATNLQNSSEQWGDYFQIRIGP